jgi:eukaryotic-like serine/threonine-protein kinase
MATALPTTGANASRAPRVARLAQRDEFEQLGPWELLGEAAEGAFSHVFRARPAQGAIEDLGAYAVKRLKSECEGDARAVCFLRREARVGRAIVSPHLVPVLDVHTDIPPYYLVMPWLEGETVADSLTASEGNSLPIPRCLWIARQIVQALDALAQAGWTHGDVKPANVMVSPVGHATLLDLGLARRPADEDRSQATVMAGTPWYMAPEVLLSTLRADIRSDIYSLGAVMYEMLTGQRPFPAADAASLVSAHRGGEVRSLRELRSDVSPAHAQLVHAMLAKEPLRRPQSPREVLQALVPLEIAHFDEQLMRP